MVHSACGGGDGRGRQRRRDFSSKLDRETTKAGRQLQKIPKFYLLGIDMAETTSGPISLRFLNFFKYLKNLWLCLMACGVLVSQPGIQPMSPASDIWINHMDHWTIC